jgi:SPP1 gp7 family putative phage head morphogenesis protein
MNQKQVDKIIDSLAPEWEKVIVASMLTIIGDFGEQTAENLKHGPHAAEMKFDPFSKAVRAWVKSHAASHVKTILDTQKAAMRDLIAEGVSNNLTNVEIAKSIRGFYEENARYLSMRVARTETAAAAGFGQREAAKQSGVVQLKRWISSRDDRVRDSHVDIDGEEQALDEPYSNGLMFPGDPDGEPSESIQCRCAEQYFAQGKT